MTGDHRGLPPPELQVNVVDEVLGTDRLHD